MNQYFTLNTTEARRERLRWKANNESYEAHFSALSSIDFSEFMSHCVGFRTKINNAVGKDDDPNTVAAREHSLHSVFPRTLSSTLERAWNAPEVAEVNDDPHPKTSEGFDAQLSLFIAAHFDETARSELVSEMRNTKLPQRMKVQDFWYRLGEANEWVPWLPGTEPALSEDQLLDSFVKSMPEKWKEKYDIAHFAPGTKAAPIVSFFKTMQTTALKSMLRNAIEQKKEQRTGKNNENLSHRRKRPRNQRDSDDKGYRGHGTLSKDAKCPIHKESNHTWGECFKNVDNPKSKRPRIDKGKPNGKPTENKQAHVAEINVVETPISTPAINDDPMDLLNGMCSSQLNLIEAFNADNLMSFSHNFVDLMSYSAINQVTNNPLEANMDCGAFSALCDEMYSSGDNDIRLVPNIDVESVTSRVRPISIMNCKMIQRTEFSAPLKVLFDTGSDRTMFNRRALPKGILPTTVPGQRYTTIHGSASLNNEVLLENLSFPEFSATRRVPGPVRASVYDNPNSVYDVILGMDVLQAIGFDISCSTKTIKWLDTFIEFRPVDYFSSSVLSASFASSSQDDPFDDPLDAAQAREAGYKSSKILHSLYERVDTDTVASQQTHLSPSQRQDLARLFSRYRKLFSGKLGKYPHRRVHLELEKDAKPVSCRPYPVSRHHQQVFKDELQRLCNEGVLSKCGASHWLSPTFIVPKKDGRVRWVSDFRALNKLIRRKVYNLPKIQDILTRRSGYEFFSKIDISMHYYTFELDEASKELCTICTPFGNYRYNRLPMGVCQSPDIAQEIMEDLFRQLEEVDVFIDDVGCFNNSWSSHLASLDRVLTILQNNNFTVNPLKCEWAVKETDWLGYWLTPRGLKPWSKKINAILAMERPKTAKQLRSFLGAVNFYRDMYPKRSHILAPLTSMSGLKGTIPWTEACQTAFDQMKALLAKEAFLQYPDHNQPFHIYTDASDVQLGSAIFQNGSPVAFYSRKLNSAQRNYTVGEKELLSIVETLKEFRSMLYGCPNLHVYTDHRNNTFQKLQTQRIMRWRLFLEDFGVHLHYIKGADNSLADALSRLPFAERQSTPESHDSAASYFSFDSTFPVDHDPDPPDLLYNTPMDCFSSMAIDNDDLLDCFVHLPSSEGTPFVLDYKSISEAQVGDARLQALRQRSPESFVDNILGTDTQVVCYIPEQHAPWKIYLPDALLHDAVKWYHLVLGHLGKSRLYDTMKQHLYHPDLLNKIEEVVLKCDTCQRQKANLRGHGHTAGREASAIPWQTVCVDLIGPWTLNVDGEETPFLALTIIDPVTNLVELVRLEDKTSAHVALMFENTWLSRYPRPLHCVYDQGGEFTGHPFQRVLATHNIRRHPISSKNPQANSICERMHQAVGNTLRALYTLRPPAGIIDARQLVDTALANCIYATRAAFHGSLHGTPGSLTFGRDMVLDIPVIADWITIQQHRQQLIDQRLIAANRKRFSYDYHPGDEVLKLAFKPAKLSPRAFGPFRIESVHTNGTVTIRLNDTTLERISIRRVKPYKR